MDALIEQLKSEWVGREFDEKTFEITRDECLGFAHACGEVRPEFTDPAHEDFQAPVTMTSRFVGRRAFPEELAPIFKLGNSFDAGKLVEPKAPVRPGDVLVGRSQIHDIYEKTGRSGGMIFIIHRMSFTNQRDEDVAIVDWRMVVRRGPQGPYGPGGPTPGGKAGQEAEEKEG